MFIDILNKLFIRDPETREEEEEYYFFESEELKIPSVFSAIKRIPSQVAHLKKRANKK